MCGASIRRAHLHLLIAFLTEENLIYQCNVRGWKKHNLRVSKCQKLVAAIP